MKKNYLVEGMTGEEYHETPNVVHVSDLKSVLTSGNHYELRKRQDRRKAFIEGDVGHTILEGIQHLSERFVVMPDSDRRTKAGRILVEKAQEKASDEGKQLIRQDLLTAALQWKENLMSDYFTRSIVEAPGRNEVSGFFEHRGRHIGCFRADKLIDRSAGANAGGRIIIDWKFMSHGSPRSFFRDVRKYRYDMQDAWYSDGMKKITGEEHEFIFVVIEKQWPWNVQSYRLDDAFRTAARRDIDLALDKIELLKVPETRGDTLGYYPGICTLHLDWRNSDA